MIKNELYRKRNLVQNWRICRYIDNSHRVRLQISNKWRYWIFEKKK